ncbi:unnamed protein product [Cuscuta epithymum]|uniref:Uncharacterized protein n=1 Tax=Cuscuta epithymum TaxID=186058 RepID=A0AAV0FUT8_9ASTE|nr:unnamed protein product [Cuscuta epithymum]CAH9139470.1 unnamed protein product [Cuscuta epithymum]
MPSPENPGSSSRLPFGSFRRAIFSIRPDQVHSLETDRESSIDSGSTASFQTLVSDRFADLSVANDDEFLSLSWIRKLLDAFGDCQDAFRATLSNSKELLSKPPQDKILSDFFDTSIKALDICNAVRDGIQKVRVWQRHLEIVVSALDPTQQQRMIGEGHFRRARKALTDLTLAMFVVDEKDTASVFSNRNRSFGQPNRTKDHPHPSPRHTRSLSWSVSPLWSASKQLQLIVNNLILPNATSDNNGLATLIFTMNHVLLCVLWVIVAAIPCQDRSGTQINVTVPVQFLWGRSLQTIHSRITDASKKRDRRNLNGLLKETSRVEKEAHELLELIDSGERRDEAIRRADALSQLCKAYQMELGPLERQLRDVFTKIRMCRAQGLEMLGKARQ